MSLAEQSLPESLVAAVGEFLTDARILGQRTGQMHLALASQPDEPSFAPEPFSPTDRKVALDDAHSLVRRVLPAARSALVDLDGVRRARLSAVVEQETALLLRFHQIWGRELSAQRIRCHGDYHLGQILRLDHDFTIIDFEGEPARSIAARKRKDSPLRDVAGLLRSFHYAANAELVWSGIDDAETESSPPTSLAEAWYWAVVSAFLRSYLDTCAGADFLPRTSSDLADLLDAYLLEKAVYEIGYELNNRPEWVGIPVAGLLQLLG
jgi:maltose alpha-D-glucosyltransferase/alpha-amylase